MRVFCAVLLLFALSSGITVLAEESPLEETDDESYEIVTGWIKIENDWYFLDENGEMKTGWQSDNAGWCYLMNNGKAAKNQWISDEGDWYFLNKYYHKISNQWKKDSKGWTYLLDDGKAAKNQWVFWSGKWYYLKNDYHMATGWQQIDDAWYYFSSSGAAYRNQWLQSGLQWYYLGSDCAMVSGTSVRINGSAQKFDVKGRWMSPQQQKLEKTGTSRKTNQIILVSGHNLSFWNKDSSGLWVKKIDVYCGYGKNGFAAASSRKEGSKTTPVGSFPITLAFGSGSNPGTSMTYRRITSKSYWSSANNSTYNTWVESSTPIRGEHLINCSVYKYALAVGFNTNPAVYGRGSAIFLHCKSADHWYTDGCISIQEKYVLSLMKSLKNGAYIIIVPGDSSITSY